ncbi:MAG: type I methionyl aminopeptidase [Clostridia bacterium]|nr:type I methionyl aminopeptidase [Clostridia bacterium]
MITIKSKREIELMREASKITALTYEMIEKNIKVGMSTYELDSMAYDFIKSQGGIPAQKGYPSGQRGVPDFPGTLCISINDEVIHGIPSKEVIIKDGDVVSVDLVVLKNGYNGDAARTYIVGNASKEAKELVEVTKQAFFEAMKYAKAGNRIGDISNAVDSYVRKFGFSVVKEFQGHGIGKEMHEDPGVPNYGKPGKGPRLEKGMTIAVEPMVIAGNPDIWELEDGWTIVTRDGSLSAHYENTILITDNEPEILTLL